MKNALESRALSACRELVACRTEVERLGGIIGNALGSCHDEFARAQEKKNSSLWEAKWETYESHLSTAYKPDVDDDGDAHYLSNDEIVAMLAVCPHCLAAHNAIQERKAARRKLGAARRAVTIIGRAPVAEAA